VIKMRTKLGRGKYLFKDLATGKKYTISSINATSAVRKLNTEAGKKVNYSFLEYKKYGVKK